MRQKHVKTADCRNNGLMIFLKKNTLVGKSPFTIYITLKYKAFLNMAEIYIYMCVHRKYLLLENKSFFCRHKFVITLKFPFTKKFQSKSLRSWTSANYNVINQ